LLAELLGLDDFSACVCAGFRGHRGCVRRSRATRIIARSIDDAGVSARSSGFGARFIAGFAASVRATVGFAGVEDAAARVSTLRR